MNSTTLESLNWEIKGSSFSSCNCDWGCPCQFNTPSTHGHCQFTGGGVIESGHCGEVDLSGLNWAEIGAWPGEIAEGNGRLQIVIDERASDAQRQALSKIMHGEVGAPGSNHFSVFHSTCSQVFDTLYLPIEFEVDIQARTGRLLVPGLIEASGQPIINVFDDKPFHVAISRSAGSFEYTYAEIGNSAAKTQGNIAIEQSDCYGQFNHLHYNQDGVVH